MVEIKKMLVPDSMKPKYHIAGKETILKMDKPEYITIHETDNEAAGATDEAHARLQLGGNSRQASWHIQVDDDSAIQSLPYNECAIAAGDGVNGPGNRKSIHIEICVNAGGDFKKAVANAADVVKQLRVLFPNIPLTNVVQHNHWSGKNCPRHLRSGDKGIKWADFLTMLNPTKDGWLKENSIWYYYKDNKKFVGWLQYKEKWYYLEPSAGKMVTGAQTIGGKPYHFDDSGALIITNKDGVIQ